MKAACGHRSSTARGDHARCALLVPREAWDPPSLHGHRHAGASNFLQKVPAQGLLTSEKHFSLLGCGQETY